MLWIRKKYEEFSLDVLDTFLRIRDRFFPDRESPTHIFESLVNVTDLRCLSWIPDQKKAPDPGPDPQQRIKVFFNPKNLF